MDELQIFSINLQILFPLAFLLIYPAGGYPISTTTDLWLEINTEDTNINEGNLENILNCTREPFQLEDVISLNDSDTFLKTMNITVHAPVYLEDDISLNDSDTFLNSMNIIVNSSVYLERDGKVFACIVLGDNSINESFTDCDFLDTYGSHDFKIFSNLSVSVFGYIHLPGEYELINGNLSLCVYDDDDGHGTDEKNTTSNGRSLKKISKYTIIIGCIISIVALITHLLIFSCLPTLRNLPGYNLASLSVAFIFAYSFALLAQIEEVGGLFCLIIGVLQQNFFLVAFFCMNVMAFDVWRTLKLATQKLILGSRIGLKRQYFKYSLYAWGFPLIIASISVLLDKIDGIPEKIKPHFGRGDICWMTNYFAKIILYMIPVFTLLSINALFFIWSFMLISNNSMKSTNEQQKQAMKFNYVLYVRLGLMMGLTWLTGIIGLVTENDTVWLIHDLVNSLQGLFLFLLFTCTRKVAKSLRTKSSLYRSKSSSAQRSTRSSTRDSRRFSNLETFVSRLSYFHSGQR